MCDKDMTWTIQGVLNGSLSSEASGKKGLWKGPGLQVVNVYIVDWTPVGCSWFMMVYVDLRIVSYLPVEVGFRDEKHRS